MQICIRNENCWTHVAYLFVETIVHTRTIVRKHRPKHSIGVCRGTVRKTVISDFQFGNHSWSIYSYLALEFVLWAIIMTRWCYRRCGVFPWQIQLWTSWRDGSENNLNIEIDEELTGGKWSWSKIGTVREQNNQIWCDWKYLSTSTINEEIFRI